VKSLFRGIEKLYGPGQEEQLAHLLQLNELPAGLEELYAFFMRLIRGSVKGERVELAPPAGSSYGDPGYLPAWEGLYLAVAGVLAVTREPLTPAQIKRFGAVPVDDSYLEGAIGRLGQFLYVAGGRYLLYHSTVSEFLTSERTRATYSESYVSPAKWHPRVAACYKAGAPGWAAVDWSQCDGYGLRHFPFHLLALTLWDECVSLAADCGLILARYRAGFSDEALADCQTVLRNPDGARRPGLRDWEAFLRRHAHLLRRGADSWRADQILL
jgi:hypothetical protein